MRRSTRPLLGPTNMKKSYNCITLYLSLIRAYNHFFPAWYLLLIFTFLVAPCCLFNQIDLSHTHSLQVQAGPSLPLAALPMKSCNYITMSLSLSYSLHLQRDPRYLPCMIFTFIIQCLGINLLNFFFSPLQSKATFISEFIFLLWRALSCQQTPSQA